MALPVTQDLAKGIDITSLPSVTGSEMNQLVDSGRTAEDKGIVLTTQDSASNTPVVPDPNTSYSGITPIWWVRYIWKRVSFNANEPVKTYHWNPQRSVPDPTYLNWEWIEADAQTALANSIIAVNTANTANATANSALTAANTAQTAATAAQATADAAQTTANSANAAATSAQSAVNTLTTQVNSLSTTVTATVNAIATLQNQVFRVPLAVFYIQERANQGVNGQTSVTGVWTKRLFTDIRCNNENLASLITLNPDSTIDLPAGTKWGIEAKLPANFSQEHKARLYSNTDSAVLLYGTSEYGDTTVAATKSEIEDYFEVNVDTNIQIDHIVNNGVANGFGFATNLGPEIYGEMKLYYFGAAL